MRTSLFKLPERLISDLALQLLCSRWRRMLLYVSQLHSFALLADKAKVWSHIKKWASGTRHTEEQRVHEQRCHTCNIKIRNMGSRHAAQAQSSLADCLAPLELYTRCERLPAPPGKPYALTRHIWLDVSTLSYKPLVLSGSVSVL